MLLSRAVIVNIFIDTNVFLSFYHFSSDDLEELNKLTVLLEQENVTLFLPDQIVDEFKRNRAGKIADALHQLRKQTLNLQFPQISKDYEEYEMLRRAQREYSRHHTQLLECIEQDVSNKNLTADQIINNLFSQARLLTTNNDLVELARLRMSIGNPPGKKGSLGDAIAWEALLAEVPEGEELFFITDDGDYSSPLPTSTFNQFLQDEWESKKASRLHPYKKLSDFFSEHFPNISLASELEKDLIIKSLANSPNFAKTHSLIAKLSSYTEFTLSQTNEIVTAAITNNQIYWIINDIDVGNFLNRVIAGREEEIIQANLRELYEYFDLEDETPEEDTDTWEW
jgi:hypothetical protein